jgi:hypothetical protein
MVKSKAVMEYYYMCRVINTDDHEIYSSPVIFKNIYEANLYGYQKARRVRKHYVIGYDEDDWVTLVVCIFKVPFGVRLVTDDISHDSGIWEYYINTIADRETRAAKTIQKKYHRHYLKRIDAAILIQERYREAMGNPYTLLCKRRLLREFNEMINLI